MKKKLTLFLVLFNSLAVMAQSVPGTVMGCIKNGGQQDVIDASTISLLKAKDSSLVKTSVTDKLGNFSFEHVQDGLYLVAATSVGYTKTFSEPVLISYETRQATTGVLQLLPVSKYIKEVVLIAKKPFIERKLDKTILNVESSISNTGSTALEVLEKAPGVSVDKDGNISLKGKQGVIVMLDGKPTYMSSVDLANYLRGMPASNLDQIEIMTNPSARYDASGNSGIINIKTKKNKQVGFNGSVATAYGQGIYLKTNNSLTLNYRKGKVNLFSTFSANYRENANLLNINRIYGNEDKSIRAIFDQKTVTKRQYKSFNAKIGMDFYANKKTTYGIVFTGYSGPGIEAGTSTSYLQSPLKIVDSIVTAESLEKSEWKNGAVNINMRHGFDSTGREITADVDFVQYKAYREQQIINNIYEPGWSKKYGDHLIGELPNELKIYSAKVDYVHPFREGLKIESGAKMSYVKTGNVAKYFNLENNVKSVDYQKTNHFNYEENINAVYVSASKTIKKWGFQLGLRAENTNYKGLQFGNPTKHDSTFKKSYTNLFPTSYVSYKVNDKNEFTASFGRRISRPDYQDLNPFLFFIDKYTYEEGNPFLRPMFSNVVELSHTYKQFFTTTFNYSHATDLFNETFRQNNAPDDSISTIVSRGNYGIVNNMSLSINAQLKPRKWLTSTIYSEGRYQEFKGDLNGEELDIQSKAFTININNQLTFKKGWAAELSGFYRSKMAEGQIIIHDIKQLDAAVKKDILKKKGSVKLSVRDIIGPMTVQGNMDFQATKVNFTQQKDSRVVTLGFNYRFGKPIKGLQKRKTGGAGEEQNRIKSAG